MTKLLTRIVDAPATWLLVMAAALLISIWIGTLSLRDVVKEIVVVTAASVVLVFMGGMRFRAHAQKGSAKAATSLFRSPLMQQRPSASTSQFPAPSAHSRTASSALCMLPLAPEKLTAECQEPRQLSKRPVLPPTFASEDFNDQADELSQQLLPTERCQSVVQEIAQDVKKIILKVLPYADVVGFTNGEVSRGTAYGVAVPEVDIVVNLPPHILVRTLQAQISKLNFSGKVDDRRLHKSGLRMCTDMLVTCGGFKFRRSAFRGRDPKVTLMAPRSFDDAACIPIDFSVNAATPLCNNVLINACAQVDPRARMLILLVKRWAKDRGICHAAKGHLMPYAWTLLCIYFLQVGVKGGSLLPPLKHLRLAGQDTAGVAGLALCLQGWHAPTPGSALAKKRLGQLFKEFISFYLEVDWRTEVASIRWGARTAPPRSLKLTVLETSSGAVVGPTIEDPFMPSENMSEMLSSTGFCRLLEELARAKSCFDSNAPLTEILTQWVPPEQKLQAELGDGSAVGDQADVGDGSGDEAEVDKDGAPSHTLHETHVDSAAASAATSEQLETPLPPWRKRSAPVGGPPSVQVTSAPPIVSKQKMTPPPGVW